MPAEDLMSSGRVLILLLVGIAIVMLVASGTLPSILGLQEKLPGENLNVTINVRAATCSAGSSIPFAPTGAHTLDIELFHKIVDPEKRTMKIATVLTVGSTTWWPWARTQPPERPTFDLVDGEAEYTYKTSMPLDSRPYVNPADPIFIGVSLWQFSGDFGSDCLVRGFQRGGAGFMFGGPFDSGQEQDDFSNIASGSLKSPKFEGCGEQFLVLERVISSARCP